MIAKSTRIYEVETIYVVKTKRNIIAASENMAFQKAREEVQRVPGFHNIESMQIVTGLPHDDNKHLCGGKK